MESRGRAMTTDLSPTGLAGPRPRRHGSPRRGGQTQTEPRVVACYSVLDTIMTASGFDDLTEGIYEGDPHRSYEAAQARKADGAPGQGRLRAGLTIARHRVRLWPDLEGGRRPGRGCDGNHRVPKAGAGAGDGPDST